MSEELFAAESVAMDSPRIQWMKRNGLAVDCVEKNGARWVCYFKGNAAGPVGLGETAEEACADFADSAGIKPWNG